MRRGTNTPLYDLHCLFLGDDVIHVVSQRRVLVQQFGPHAPYHARLGLVEAGDFSRLVKPKWDPVHTLMHTVQHNSLLEHLANIEMVTGRQIEKQNHVTLQK